jgi:hypothetical protein
VDEIKRGHCLVLHTIIYILGGGGELTPDIHLQYDLCNTGMGSEREPHLYLNLFYMNSARQDCIMISWLSN